jgi:hypothetical protein
MHCFVGGQSASTLHCGVGHDCVTTAHIPFTHTAFEHAVEPSGHVWQGPGGGRQSLSDLQPFAGGGHDGY